MVAGKALDAIGGQIFYYVNSRKPLLLPLDCGQCGISHYLMASRATPATNGNWREQHIQPTGNNE
jgi:hypothetical protein